MASTGGNLLQRTRCLYFYDTTTPCNKRQPGSGCSAVAGINRMHAILGTSAHCIAVNPSDMCVVLAALDARVLVMCSGGERSIPFADFHRLPDDTPHIDSNLRHDEIIIGIELPPQGFAKNYTYLKLRDRLSFAFALVSVAAGLDVRDGTIKEARLALGGVAHKPWRDRQAEARLAGAQPSPENFLASAEIVLRQARGFCHNDFKIELARRAILRAHPGRARLSAVASGQADSMRRRATWFMSAVLGKPASRIEGREKVTGAAKYAGEYNVATLAHGFVVSSAIAKGRIKNIQTADVLAVPGVLDVLTHVHRPPLADSDEKYKDDIAPDGSPFRPLYDDQIRFSGQPIALVVAEELEIARYAASLVRVEFEQHAHETDLDAQRQRGAVSKETQTHRAGKAAQAFERAPVQVKAEYRIAVEHHNPMEPYATTAVWEGDGRITLTTRRRVARTAGTTSPASVSCRPTRCAYCHRMWAAASDPDCAPSISYPSRCLRRARSSDRCG
jgi:CO/xanthine dehydrogenase FAD-binding subunit